MKPRWFRGPVNRRFATLSAITLTALLVVLFGYSHHVRQTSERSTYKQTILLRGTAHVVTVPGLQKGQGGWHMLDEILATHRRCEPSATPPAFLDLAIVPQSLAVRRYNLTRLDAASAAAHSGRVIVSTFSTEVVSLVVPFLRSVAEHNSNVLVVLLAVGINDDDLSALDLLRHHLTPDLQVEILALTPESLAVLFNYQQGSPGILQHIPVATMARVLLPALTPALAPLVIDHVVYLDLDVSVKGDLTPLFAGQVCNPPLFGENESNGVCGRSSLNSAELLSWWLTPIAKCVLVTPRGPANQSLSSFNAGVAVMSVAHMESWGFPAFAVAISSLYGVNDQVVLSLYVQDTGLSQLDPRYNRWSVSTADTNLPTNSSIIFHFNGAQKPWSSPIPHPWQSLFFKNEPPSFVLVWSSLVSPFGTAQLGVIRAAARMAGAFPLQVFCSTSYCGKSVSDLSLINVRVHMIGLSTLVSGPFGYWFQQHPIIKIHAGDHYPHQFQVAVELSALHEFGGVLLPWTTSLDRISFNGSTLLDVDALWCMPVAGGGRIMGAAKHHDSIPAFGAPFVSQGKAYAVGDARPHVLPSSIMSGCGNLPRWEGAAAATSTFPLTSSTGDTEMAVASWTAEKHFGVLWYDERTRYLTSVGNPGVNLGDEVQAIAGAQWLPMVNKHVERDNMAAVSDSFSVDSAVTPIIMFLNAWYGTPSMTWPPPPNIDPLLVAVHVEPAVRKLFSSNESISYLQLHEPIGARDTITRDLFAAHQITTFMSGCLTLTMQRPRIDVSAGCDILLVDVSDHVKARLPQSVRDRSCTASPKYLDGRTGDRFDGFKRFTLAHELLQKYASAKLIVTSRLHTALPSASMGVPVLLVLEKNMPGGGGDERFAGLSQLVHHVYIDDENDSAFDNFSWNDPQPNPSPRDLQNFRCGFLQHLGKYGPAPAATVAFADVLRLFDFSIFPWHGFSGSNCKPI